MRGVRKSETNRHAVFAVHADGVATGFSACLPWSLMIRYLWFQNVSPQAGWARSRRTRVIGVVP